MRPLRRGCKRLIGLFTGGRREREITDELDSHIQMQTEDYIRLGLPPEEARRAAALKFGSLESAKEGIRSQRGLPRLESLMKDANYAARGLRRNPGFAASVILTLALGIGANTAIFDVAYAVLLKPLPYPDPEHLYSVGAVIPERKIGNLPLPIQIYLEWRKSDTVFASMSAIRPWQGNLTGDGEPEHVGGARVSANFFSVLGVPVAQGRTFSPGEEQPGSDRVVVISDALWRRRYAADPDVIGRKIDVNGEAHVVVGIAPPSLLVPTGTQMGPRLAFSPRIDIWKPIAPTRAELQGENWNHAVLVRLKRGSNPEIGRQQLQALLNARIRAQAPAMKLDLITQLEPLREVYAGKARLPLLLVLGAASLLLLTACVNIANLFLVRAANRSAELATRIALGAGRARIVSQALTESVLLAVLGGAAGAVIAKCGTNLLAALGPDDMRYLADTRANLPAILFATTASVITGVVCGLFQMGHVYRKGPSSPLQEGARAALGGSRTGRIRRILVATEMALGTVLLISAGLLLHSFINVTGMDRGYQVERVLTVDLALSGPRYAEDARRVAFYRELARDIAGLPGVLAAGAISQLPAIAGSAGAQQTIFYEADTNFQSVVLKRPVALIRSITAGYFAASGSALRAGRLFTDQEETPVALISESMAARLWPGESPASVPGRALRHGDVTGAPILVAGVVQEVRSGAGDREPMPVIYRPDNQWTSGAMSLVLRTAHEPGSIAAAVRSEIRRLNPNLPITSIRTMREIVSESVAQRRFQMILISLFALVALLLGGVGIYGIVSYSVACRTREVGLRVALGAMRSDVIRAVISEGMKPVLAGLLVGLAAGVAIATALRSLLYGITPADPLSLGVVTALLLFTSGMACYIPARRAARLDPMIALRHE
jgi:putative ABC transport system permease protein